MKLDEFIKGAFFGALILCVFMLNFSEPKACFIQWGNGSVSHVKVGQWHE